MRKPLVILLVLALAGAGVWWFKLRPAPEENGRLTLYGNVDIRQVELGFRVSGRVAEMRFEEGGHVEAGQLLARLDDQPYLDKVRLEQARLDAQRAVVDKFRSGSRPEEVQRARAKVEELESAFRNASRVYERRKKLFAERVISEQNFDDALTRMQEANKRLRQAREELRLLRKGFRDEDVRAQEAEMEVAEARLASARTDLEDTVLYAPSRGIILTRVREPGAVVASGQPVYALTFDSPVWVRAWVAEPDLGRVYPGQKARVFTDSRPDEPYVGHVGFISPRAEFTPKTVQTTRLRTELVYRLRVVVDNPDRGLRQGMPVTVKLETPPPGEVRQSAGNATRKNGGDAG
ncbi:secretion protein HlyD [Desulfohalovibrio reitneri]|uniref:secretion protein HlyD n=1 Tax=Desulfohalovibrio reitneri TaxID=1307759 RepID=UPI0009DFE125|nr:secretion protein HlyD [Desulfohalovibrio reitneri]